MVLRDEYHISNVYECTPPHTQSLKILRNMIHNNHMLHIDNVQSIDMFVSQKLFFFFCSFE